MSDREWGFGDELRFQQEESEARRAERDKEVGEEREAASRSMKDWAALVPEPKFGVLNWEDFPYQLEWYSDECAAAREVCWQKSTQVGMSAYAWRWGARRADQFSDTVIYIFPTDRHVTEFGDERIEPSIGDSEYLQSRIRPGYVKNKHQKRIGGGWMYLRGSTSRAGAQSVAGDSLVFDEYDELDRANVAQMERRLSGAKAAGREPRIRRLGVPTLPAWGIAAEFDRSDQRYWHVTCPACGEEQPIEWERNVRWTVSTTDEVMSAAFDEYVDADDVVKAWRACRACDFSLEAPRGERFGPIHAGRWAATRESRTRGYHVSRLIVPNTDLIEIVKNSRKTGAYEVIAFWNNDLGYPYSPEENGLTEEEVKTACSYGDLPVPGYSGQWPVIMGIDQAGVRDQNVCIYERPPDAPRRALWIGTVPEWTDIDPLMRDYNVTLAVADSLPDRKGARALASRFPGRVLLAMYNDSNPDADPVTFDEKKNLVTVHRTEAIDGMMDAVRHGRSIPLKRVPHLYVAHMIAMKAKIEETPRGRPVRVYVTTGGKGDDYAHAEVMTLVASEMVAMKQAAFEQEMQQQMAVGDEEMGVAALHLDAYPGPADEFDPYGDGADPDLYDPGFGGY